MQEAAIKPEAPDTEASGIPPCERPNAAPGHPGGQNLIPFAAGKSFNPAGRPRGSENRSTRWAKTMRYYQNIPPDKRLTPLDVFALISNDPNRDVRTRLRAAEAAAPFLHPKMPPRLPQDDPGQAAAKIRELMRAMKGMDE